ncbi:MAG: helix-turn-helix domain-containing protein [Oscillospiraceae bacterium]|nr:helix-turn-helix domain-containing protein [Oscillospiraceae bacterium]
MPMDYSRLHAILESNGTTLYKLNAEKVIGSATRQKLLGQIAGGIDSRTIEALCKRLHCQPGDFMTYIPESEQAKE